MYCVFCKWSFFLLALSVSCIQTIGYLCSQEYSKLEGCLKISWCKPSWKVPTLIRLYGIGLVLSFPKTWVGALSYTF